MEEARSQLAWAREHAMEARQQARQSLRESRQQLREQREKSRVFFMQGKGRNRNFKIQKQIRIRMPKGARLKLDIRHGEVKLAENVIDLNATLSYANLLASNIAGEQTRVRARYSPLRVKQWDAGRLDTDFSEDVQLERVIRLNLRATSSDITIDHLLKNASIRNELGGLYIGSIGRDFEDLSVTVLNGELDCALPESDVEILLTNQGSDIDVPHSVVWEGEADTPANQKRGFRGNRDPGRAIVINSSYSKVRLRE